MAYWLFKSEPGAWSWDDHVKKGVEHWDGIRNHQANNNMKEMRIGDKAFFFSSCVTISIPEPSRSKRLRRSLPHYRVV